MTPRITVIVPVYNEEKTLSLCLDSLMNLDFPKEHLEIIVVDNNSTDATKDIARRYPVKYVFESERGRGAAKNKGIKESGNELIAFIDADCIADKAWLRNIIKVFTSKSIAGCGGRILSYKPQSPLEKYYELKGIFSKENKFCMRELFLPTIGAANAVYRRDVLEEVGLFDNSFIANEDVDLTWKVYLKGCLLSYAPEAIVYHKNIHRLTAFFRKHFESGYTYSYLLQKYAGLIKKSLVGYDDWLNLFFQLSQSAKAFFLALFTGKSTLEKIFPIFDIIKDVSFFSGRLYGLARLKLKIEKISSQPNLSNKLPCRIVNDEAIILDTNRDFHYVLNKTGTRIWTLLIEGKDTSEITETIANEYKADKEEVKNDLTSLIGKLKKEGLVSKPR